MKIPIPTIDDKIMKLAKKTANAEMCFIKTDFNITYIIAKITPFVNVFQYILIKWYNSYMKNKTKKIIKICAFILLLLLLWGGYRINRSKMSEFNALQTLTQSYSATTIERVANSIVTLPDGNTVVGIKDFIGLYKYTDGSTGKAEIAHKYLKTNFIEGAYRGKSPRLDALVPMTVDIDSLDGSTFIVLFHDRGDVALEKSYARIGDISVVIGDIYITKGEKSDEEYRVTIDYSQRSIPKKIIIPVIDGHFNAERAITGTEVLPSVPTSEEPVACTMEAKQCPDGSFVGRTGPKCEFQACPNTTEEKGTLSGKVSIGPVCGGPERIDNPCKPTKEMYAARKVYVYKSDRKTLVTTLTPDSEGRFSTSLTVGGYYVDVEKSGPVENVIGAPTTVLIKWKVESTIHIEIDTGIR